MNGMITVNENYDLDTIIPQLKAYTTGKVVEKVTCREKEILKGDGPKVALLDLGAKRNIARSLNERGCEVTIYPALTPAEEILEANPDGIMLSNGPGDPKECTSIIKEIKNYMILKFRSSQSVLDISLWLLQQVEIPIR